MVDPYFTMLWSETIPVETWRDDAGRATRITMVAGAIGAATPPAPPPNSWAARPESDIAIWTLELEPGARLTLPAAKPGSNRVLYSFRGETITLADRRFETGHAIQVRADVPLTVENGKTPGELLMLQGRPIGEPVAQHGPFVMNTTAEIRQAMLDYQSTGFGGWPWKADAPVHRREEGRFAIHANGKRESPV